MEEIIDIEALNPIYRELADLIGPSGMLKVHQNYQGIQLTLPIHLYDRKTVKAIIKANKLHLSTSQLVRKYGYSQRWVGSIQQEKKGPVG